MSPASLDIDDRLVPNASLRDRALGVLRQAVVSGEIRAGELYSAAALARQMGVSASPVREAMLTLVHEGIMEPVRNRGFRLVPWSAQDLDDVVEMRMLLEVPVVKSLAARGQTEGLAEHRVRAGAAAEAAARGDAQGFLIADRNFHMHLLIEHGNQRITDCVLQLRDQTRLYAIPQLAGHGLLEEGAAEHFHILDAIEAGDEQQASALMTRHLQRVREEWADDGEGRSGASAIEG